MLHKNIPTTAKCLFEDWNCYAIQFTPFDFKECSFAEKENYLYTQREKQFEFSNGNTDYAYKQYSDLSAVIKRENYLLNTNNIKTAFNNY